MVDMYNSIIHEHLSFIQRDHSPTICFVYWYLVFNFCCYACRCVKFFMELLHDIGFLCQVLLAKFEGKDSEMEVLVHVANGEAFPKVGHIFDQMRSLVDTRLHFGDCFVAFRLIEWHICFGYMWACWGSCTIILPFVFRHKGHPIYYDTVITTLIGQEDTIASVMGNWGISKTLFIVWNILIIICISSRSSNLSRAFHIALTFPNFLCVEIK